MKNPIVLILSPMTGFLSQLFARLALGLGHWQEQFQNKVDSPLLSEDTYEALVQMELEEEERQLLAEGLNTLLLPWRQLRAESLALALDQIYAATIYPADPSPSPPALPLLWRDLYAGLLQNSGRGIGYFASLPRSLRRVLVSWWYDAWLAQLGMEQIRSYVQSPFHYPPVEDRVRSTTRNQIKAYHKSAKKKLIDKLKAEKKKALADEQKARDQGKSTEADRKKWQAKAYDWAIDEIEQSIT